MPEASTTTEPARYSLPERVTSRLRQHCQGLAVGARLGSEQQVRKRSAVSMPKLREPLTILEKEGTIIRRLPADLGLVSF